VFIILEKIIEDKTQSDFQFDSELLTLITKVSDLIHDVREKFYDKFDLTSIQFRALLFLFLADKTEGLTLSDLSEKLSVSKPNTTSLIDRMEAKGLVQRVNNSEDRRSLKVLITDKAEKIMYEIQPQNTRLDQSLLDFLTRKEKENLYSLILKMITVLNGYPE
jgi:DNA-binding MarR family transcriptional regulator